MDNSATGVFQQQPGPQPNQSSSASFQITTCEHTDELSVFVGPPHNRAFCNDCYFEEQSMLQAKGKTLKKAADEQIKAMGGILKQVEQALSNCTDLQNAARNQDPLIDEVKQKLNRQFEQLKQIIDQQNTDAQQVIGNLESVQEYKKPDGGLLNACLTDLQSFQSEMTDLIEKQERMSQSQKYIDVLQDQVYLKEYQDRFQGELSKLNKHQRYMTENARPKIEVLCEVDKFRGFLQDVISFQPDFILQAEKPRLHYFDEDRSTMMVHDLATQNTTAIQITNCDLLPQFFSSIQVQNKIYLVGGERRENEVRTVVSTDLFVLNEQTCDVQKCASLNFGRAGHQLAHLHRRFDFKTKDYIYAVGSKYPDDTSFKTEVYDVSKNKWTVIGDLHQKRHYHSLCVVEGRYLYAIGGRDSMSEAPLDSFERLDGFAELEQQKWECVNLVNKDGQWSARDTVGSFSISNQQTGEQEILIFGGDYGWISDCFSFNCKTNEIEKAQGNNSHNGRANGGVEGGEVPSVLSCALKKPEEFFRCARPVHWNEKVYMVGCLDKDVHVFTPRSRKWFLLEKWFVDW